jgi:hypothetical protein
MSVLLNLKNVKSKLFIPIILLPVWYLIYHYLQPLTDWFIDTALGLEKGKHLTEALRFFIFELPKVLLLLALIIFFVALSDRTFRPNGPEKSLRANRLLQAMY